MKQEITVKGEVEREPEEMQRLKDMPAANIAEVLIEEGTNLEARFEEPKEEEVTPA